MIYKEHFTRDLESGATYVRFLDTKVAYTQQIKDEGGSFIADYDSQGQVIGVEFLGKRAKEIACYRSLAQQKSKGPKAFVPPKRRLAG